MWWRYSKVKVGSYREGASSFGYDKKERESRIKVFKATGDFAVVKTAWTDKLLVGYGLDFGVDRWIFV